jgi:hypothetical protein
MFYIDYIAEYSAIFADSLFLRASFPFNQLKNRTTLPLASTMVHR